MDSNLAQAAAPFAQARTIVEAYGRSALDHFKLLPDKSLFFSADRSAFLAYREALGTAVVLGGPVGPPRTLPALLRSFLSRHERRGHAVVFLQIGAQDVALCRVFGLSPVRIGANAIVNLATFDLRSPGAKPLRYALGRLGREGLAVKHIAPPLGEALLEKLSDTNESWLRLPGRFERGFSVGRFDRPALRRATVSIVERADGAVVAFVNRVPSFARGETTVDLIRRRRDAPAWALDALMTGVLLDARARGYSRFDLGLAPLARIGGGPCQHPAERVERFIFRYGGRRFGQAGLHAWKAKFATTWETQWLAYRGGPLAFARACWAIRRVVREEDPLGEAKKRNGASVAPGSRLQKRTLNSRMGGSTSLRRPHEA